MHPEDDCPSCHRHLDITPEYIDGIVALRKSSGEDIAGDDVYQARLQVCRACKACVDGVLCIQCGCFVQFRALGLRGYCPDPAGDRWAGKGEELA